MQKWNNMKKRTPKKQCETCGAITHGGYTGAAAVCHMEDTAHNF